MYKALRIPGGWFVFWLETPESEPTPVARPVYKPSDEEHKFEPYPSKSAAYRRCKKLNDAVQKVDAMIAETGAIII
jgi:hypothetical protein